MKSVAMATWLKVQEKAKGRDSQDIRKFIRVHGKVISSSSQAESRERESEEEFSRQPPSSASRPTKQLTLAHFNKKKPSQSRTSTDKAKDKERTKSSESQKLFLPAVKFSTGVRRKAKVEMEENKENEPSQEGEPDRQRRVEKSLSPLRRVNHKSPCSVETKKRRGRLQPLSPANRPLPPSGNQSPESEVRSESPGGFLSSRKKTVKNRGQLSKEASKEKESTRHLISEVAMHQLCGPSLERREKEERVAEKERGLSEPDSLEDSDLYINTDELLEGLVNCEKALINAHTHNNKSSNHTKTI